MMLMRIRFYLKLYSMFTKNYAAPWCQLYSLIRFHVCGPVDSLSIATAAIVTGLPTAEAEEDQVLT